MSTASSPTLLIADDDDAFRGRAARAFADRGYEVRAVSSGEEAVAAARAESPELALVDLRMAGMDGLQLVSELLAIDPRTKVVVLTGYGSIATALEAVRLGAVHYLSKPASLDELLAAFQRGEIPPPPTPIGTADAEVPSLARMEWEHIQRVLTDCGGNVTRAAELLGLHRRTLQRKLSKHPVRR